jgi:arsenate reductase (glutaredoxin)
VQAVMTEPITIYGIKNCDTMRKARTWLETHGVAYSFHDYKAQGIGRDVLKAWAGAVGWEALLNRSGMTFRKLPEAEKADLDATRAVALMMAHPSAIKRPVLDAGGTLTLGFNPETYAAALRAFTRD